MTGVLQAIRDDGPISRTGLAASTGLSTARVTAIANELETTGAIRSRKDRRLVSARAKHDVPAAQVAKAAAERRELQRQYAKSAVEMVRTYADSTDCRRRIVLELLGESHPKRCGHCDNCDRGESTDSADRPFAVGSPVTHRQWGRGTVQTYEEGDRIVVLFDTAGYKTLSLDLVENHHLLTPA
jgi:ATP-dependent DNA helicase RecQ